MGPIKLGVPLLSISNITTRAYGIDDLIYGCYNTTPIGEFSDQLNSPQLGFWLQCVMTVCLTLPKTVVFGETANPSLNLTRETATENGGHGKKSLFDQTLSPQLSSIEPVPTGQQTSRLSSG